MSNKKDKNEKQKNSNNTKYGEFVCTEFGWITPDKQKKNAERFDNITKQNETKN